MRMFLVYSKGLALPIGLYPPCERSRHCVRNRLATFFNIITLDESKMGDFNGLCIL